MTRRVWLLALGAIAVRFASSFTLAVVAPDGARYLHMARLLEQGRFGDALNVFPRMHPLYPLLIAFGDSLTHRDLAVGISLSAILGGLALVPLYFLARNAWGERAATLASVFYVFLPDAVILHGDVMTEGTFMFFFFTAMAVGWSALEKKSWEQAILAGACSALAWLARPEGIYLPLLFALACALRFSRFSVAALGLFLATAFILMYPYLVFIKAQTGHWAMSANPFSKGIIGLFTGETEAKGFQVNEKSAEEFEEYGYIHKHGRFLGPVLYTAKTISRNLFHVLAPFLVIGFFRLRSPEGKWGPRLYLLAAAVGYFIPSILVWFAAMPFGHRYTLPTFVLLLPVAALGLLKAVSWVRHPKALPIFVGVVCLVMTAKVMTPKRTNKIGLKQAGLAIREKLGPDRKILAMARQVEYYAQGEFVEFPPLPDGTFANLEKRVAEQKVDAIAFYQRDLRNYEQGLQERVEKKYALLGEYPASAKDPTTRVRVYVTALSP